MASHKKENTPSGIKVWVKKHPIATIFISLFFIGLIGSTLEPSSPPVPNNQEPVAELEEAKKEPLNKKALLTSEEKDQLKQYNSEIITSAEQADQKYNEFMKKVETMNVIDAYRLGTFVLGSI